MTGPFANRLFRIAFALAGIYNLAFGVWAGFWPRAFFELFEIPPPRYPGIWACLGMVVGVYGLLYLHTAWKLDTARPIIAVGLLGKVLGPIGMATSFADDWPLRLGMLCVYNDLIWWLPFGLFLVRGTSPGRRLAELAPWWCVSLHGVALVWMFAYMRPGMLTEPSLQRRAEYMATSAAAWSFGWALWMLSALSLVGFYAWWGCRLNHSRRALRAATAAVAMAAFGMVFDFSGEALSALVLVEQAQRLEQGPSPTLSAERTFLEIERAATLLTAGAANFLYTLGGLILMLVTPDLPRAIRWLMAATWLAGFGMTVAGLLHHVGGMVVSTAILFPLLIGWTLWMATRWRRT